MKFNYVNVYEMWLEFLEQEDMTEDEYPFEEYEKDILDDIREMHHYGEI